MRQTGCQVETLESASGPNIYIGLFRYCRPGNWARLIAINSERDYLKAYSTPVSANESEVGLLDI
jgi:hypothetical protein